MGHKKIIKSVIIHASCISTVVEYLPPHLEVKVLIQPPTLTLRERENGKKVL
jgi:hypothetical protein